MSKNSNAILTIGVSLLGGGFIVYGVAWGLILQNLPTYARSGRLVGASTGSTAVVEGFGFIAMGVLIILRGLFFGRRP